MGRDRKFTSHELLHAAKELVLKTGYEGFTFGQLGKELDVSRAAIYKYYTNKDELLMDVMLDAMSISTQMLQSIDNTVSFHDQLSSLLDKIMKMKDLHQTLSIMRFIPDTVDTIQQKKQQLNNMHHLLYAPLNHVVEQGKREGIINNSIPNELILGFIFQTIEIPNMNQLDEVTYMRHIHQFILHGITS